MTAKEHLQSFLETIQKPGCTVEEAMRFLTVTQQHESKFVGNITPINQINGILSLLQKTKGFTIAEKYSANKLVTDCKIKLKTESKPILLQCRLVKEIDVRKASEEGQWGIHASSFQNITK